MTTWRAGMLLTSERMNDHSLESVTTTGATAFPGWTVLSFNGRKVNGITTVTLACSLTGGNITEIATNSGNISDNSMATLPAGWRPPEQVECIWNSGFNDGGATVNTLGVVTLRTTSGSAGIAGPSPGPAHAPRITVSWISENA